MPKTELTGERLRAVLHYDPLTGLFSRIGSSQKTGCDNGAGYIAIRVDGRSYRAHRLAFLYMEDRWPVDEVDHINGSRSDNSWCNLREVSTGGNTRNQRRPHKNNKVGLLGVKRRGSAFVAQITINRIQTYIGAFDSPEAAHKAYVERKRVHHQTCTL